MPSSLLAAGARCAFVLTVASVSARAQEVLGRYTIPLPSDRFGTSVAALGDIDGDGVPDLVAGDPDPKDSNGGQVILFSGATGAELWRLQTQQNNNQFGFDLDNVGDVDGDGKADLLVGAPLKNTTQGVDSGETVLVSGATGRILLRRLGLAPGEQSGWSVSGVGDLDGDGIPDQMVGTGGSGPVRVFSGATTNVIYTLSGDPGASPRFGSSVDWTPDLDGDGVIDLLVGDPGDSTTGVDAGAAYVFSGASGLRLGVVHGRSAGDLYGTRVLGLQDVDGDGSSEFLVTAAGRASDRGRVDLYSFARARSLYFLKGDVSGEQLGYDVRRIGDVTGDGVMDFGLISRFSFSWRCGRSGEILFRDDLQLSDPPERSFATIDDLNGDGRGDVLHPGMDSSFREREIKARASNDLYLWSDVVPPYDDPRLRVRAGPALAPAAIYVESVNLIPVGRFLRFGILDANGDWDVSNTVAPPGLGGLNIVFRAYAVQPGGSVVDSVQVMVNISS